MGAFVLDFLFETKFAQYEVNLLLIMMRGVVDNVRWGRDFSDVN